MKGKIFLTALSVLALLPLSGCLLASDIKASKAGQQTVSVVEQAKSACVELCNAERQKAVDLSSGPCLGNPLSGLPDWVCDIAHSPRQPVDNQPENQCSAFREGKARHFVEVDEGCELMGGN